MSAYTESVPDARNWENAAACAAPAVDSDWFHAGERNPLATENARTVCNSCPVRTACLTDAYTEGDEWGIRAGLTPRQRRANLRKADGNIARAVADAVEDVTLLLRQIYQRHTQPAGDGHVVWADARLFVTVRGRSYTVHQLAWVALHREQPDGHVQRSCEIEGCVAEGCLTHRAERWMRDRAAEARKKAAV